ALACAAPSQAEEGSASNELAARHDKPSIVLVHGAFADGSAWSAVVPHLLRAGYSVTAVQNSLFSLAQDVATTKRIIEQQPGDVIVVGHSYGGAVITGAAANNEKVRALVYVAAFAPEDGEPVGAFNQQYPADLGTALVPDTAGFLTIDPTKFHDIFAADLALSETRVMATAQKPLIGSAFGESVPHAAWHDAPSWYVVAQHDRAIQPALERFYAKRMNATTVELPTSHVPFLSRPQAIARVILEAARRTE
ncbi:MAG TPA: alpha/beta hydrolase, partial [Polyangiales bacterium]|nr:alpha/beta hydrolase [Polyangiales bacterium]